MHGGLVTVPLRDHGETVRVEVIFPPILRRDVVLPHGLMHGPLPAMVVEVGEHLVGDLVGIEGFGEVSHGSSFSCRTGRGSSARDHLASRCGERSWTARGTACRDLPPCR